MMVIDPAFQHILERFGVADESALARRFQAQATPSKPRTIVVHHCLSPAAGAGPGLDVFYKEYRYPKPSWSFVGRASKARREYENYGVFDRLGIPAARRIAFGEQRDALGRLKGAFILTEAIPGASSLRELVQTRPGSMSRRARIELYRQGATLARRLHDAGFCHNDLVWRNLLVTWPAPDAPKLWWIDCPRGHFLRWPWQRRRKRIKDLASAYKSAFRFCSRADQLRLILLYQGRSALDEPTKRLIRDVVAFGRRRWPEDWAVC
jgi:hypothetical protein